MFKVLLYVFLIYLAYQFIFNFLVPVFKTTQRIRHSFREMNNNKNFENQHDSSPDQSAPSNNSKKPVGEYIDFEEIK